MFGLQHPETLREGLNLILTISALDRRDAEIIKILRENDLIGTARRLFGDDDMRTMQFRTLETQMLGNIREYVPKGEAGVW